MWILAATHAVSTLMMAGIIWFVQLVHYPLFVSVGEERFDRFEKQHVRRTTWIVAPLMLGETVTAVALAFLAWGRSWGWWTLLGVALLGVIWASTVWLQVPCHRKLESGLDPASVRRLVRTNWIRTMAWSARAVVAIVILRNMASAAET